MTLRPWPVLVGILTSCASPRANEPDIKPVRHVDRIAGPSSTAKLAGDRCAPGASSCTCRSPGQLAERTPPPDGLKRFELRMSADGGDLALDVPGVGKFTTSGAQEVCFYVDVPAGSTHRFDFQSRAADRRTGFTPRLRLAEYGPAGPFWYDVLAIDCAGEAGRCDQAGAKSWASRTAATRKRGRLDPCGSAVVSGLAWQTSGSEASRDGGQYQDFSVRFNFEVKKFATQFAPGSTECVPK
jgi:hypothetical protein